MEYSITAEELREILHLVETGWNCERFEADETLYLRLTNGSKVKKFEFIRCQGGKL